MKTDKIKSRNSHIQVVNCFRNENGKSNFIIAIAKIKFHFDNVYPRGEKLTRLYGHIDAVETSAIL